MADQTTSTTGGSTSAAAMLNQPIVIDCGSSSMKAGFAGGTKPKVSLDEPTFIFIGSCMYLYSPLIYVYYAYLCYHVYHIIR